MSARLETVGDILDEMDAEKGARMGHVLEGEVVQVGGDIVLAVEAQPSIVLLDAARAHDFYQKMKAAVADFKADTSTERGRKAIASEAFKVTKTKTAIDAARKKLTEEWRHQTNLVNDAGKDIREKLEALAAEVRKPLTDWEAAEDERIVDCGEIIADFKAAAVVTIDDTSASVTDRGRRIWGIDLDADKFQDLLPAAQEAKNAAVNALKAARARLEREEADQAELEKLRAANAEREALAAKAAEEERAKRAEEATQKAEADRLARLQQDAADKAKADAERVAQAERDRVQREHEAALAVERERAEAAERAQREAKAAADAEAAAQAERERNQKHRAAVMGAAKQAIMTCGVVEDIARAIVLAIKAGEVPHVRIDF